MSVNIVSARVTEGSKWIAAHARGRKDPIVYTVRGVTQLGIFVTSCESRSPHGNLYSQVDFLKLFCRET